VEEVLAETAMLRRGELADQFTDIDG